MATADNSTFLLRSDGTLERATGSFVIPQGRFLQIAGGFEHMLGVRTDGTVIAWGGYNQFGQCDVPPLLNGLKYVDIAAGRMFSVARRSDGSMVAWGDNQRFQRDVPTLPPGMTLSRLVSGHRAEYTMAFLASGAFNWSGEGCAGSSGVTDLAAAQPPRLGQVFAVDLAPWGPHAAVLLTGASNTVSALGPLPIDLSILGMTNCRLRVSPDLLLPMSRNPPRAQMLIPNDPALAGALFHQQALLLDSGANAFGAVLSHAATGMIGM
jgi:hypothetical protein